MMKKSILGLGLAGLMMVAAPLMGQVTTTDAGFKGIVAGVDQYDAGGVAKVVNWSSFITQRDVEFINNDIGVLNKITSSQAAQINDVLTSKLTGGAVGGNLYFSAPSGILFGNGAKINATNFLATTADLSSVKVADLNTWGAGAPLEVAKLAFNADKPMIAFSSYGPFGTLSFSGGSDKNLWLIGSDQPEPLHTAQWGVGAYNADQSKGPSSMANVTYTNDGNAHGVFILSSADKKMWLGDVVADANPAYFYGSQIWVQSVKLQDAAGNVSGDLYMVGGNGKNGDLDVAWNDGVWVYGHHIEPLKWPKGADYDNDVILSAKNISIMGHQIWISAKTNATGNIELGDTANNIALNNPLGPVGNTLGNHNTFIIWTLDLVAGGNIDLVAKGETQIKTPWIYGLNSIPKGKGGSIWVNSMNAAGNINAEATYGIVAWNYGDKIKEADLVKAGAGSKVTFAAKEGNYLFRGDVYADGVKDTKWSGEMTGVYANDDASMSYYW